MPCALEHREGPLERVEHAPSPAPTSMRGRAGSSACPSSTDCAHVDDGAVVRAGVRAQQLERGAVGDAVALHEDPLGALDDRAAVQRAARAGRPARSAAPRSPRRRHRDLDRALQVGGRVGARVRVDAALGGSRARTPGRRRRAARSPGPLAYDAQLVDEVERVLVVAVHDDDREVRVLGRRRARPPRATSTANEVTWWPRPSSTSAVRRSAASSSSAARIRRLGCVSVCHAEYHDAFGPAALNPRRAAPRTELPLDTRRLDDLPERE